MTTLVFAFGFAAALALRLFIHALIHAAARYRRNHWREYPGEWR